MPKVLALNKNGALTYCTVAPEMRGKGRCNHVEHQATGESPNAFVERIAARMNEILVDKQEEAFFIPQNGAVVDTKPLRFTDEEKARMTQIQGRLQLEVPLETDGAYIPLEEPLWNDMDKNYFSSISGVTKKNINAVLHGDAYIILEGTNVRGLQTDRFITKEYIAKYCGEEKFEDVDLDYFQGKCGIRIETGVKAMNEYAAKYDFEATRDVYVLPYYMRMGVPNENGEMVDSHLTIAYKYLLRNHSKPDVQQIAYEALLNNNALPSDKARYTNRYRNSSLADEFAGKGGIFRAALSGNSIPYSARAVITPSIDIKPGEVAIPPAAAVDLYKPTLIHQLASEGYDAEQIESWFDKYRVEQTQITTEDREDLERRIYGKRVLMNRQPSLHVSSLQSFRPRVSPNASCQIRPEYCKAYGGDFDGDCVSLYAINSEAIIPTIDKELDYHNDFAIKTPRATSKSAILPSKDALWGLLNILDKRDDK